MADHEFMPNSELLKNSVVYDLHNSVTALKGQFPQK